MADETSYGWAGKILRVNLSTGSITTQPTDPYESASAAWAIWIVIRQEVPAGTDILPEEQTTVG